MRVKIFSQINDICALEKRVNEWLESNESFVIKHILQSEYAIGNCGDGCMTFSIWYVEETE